VGLRPEPHSESGMGQRTSCVEYVSKLWFARAIEISRFFCDLILMEAFETNNTFGYILISACKLKLVCFQHLNLIQSISSTF
jgi:hypothetical protein